MAKIANFPTPLYLAPLFGVTPFESIEKLYGSWNYRVFRAADGEDLVILACTVFDWITRATDRRTERIATAKTRWKQLAAFARINVR